MSDRGDRFLGANLTGDGVYFAVWAPKAKRVEVEIQKPDGPTFHPLTREPDGLHAGVVSDIGAGTRYKFRLDGQQSFPDPRSRFQPEGVHGPSEVIDPAAFTWTDDDWPGLTMDGLVVYETHVGCYTPEGTFEALIGQLPEIKRLGVDAIELMPVAECPGSRNWGYDGVDLFAPSRNYGRPDDLRRLVDAAHREGLGVLLDVVYNHLGPDGNYLRAFSDDYFTDRHKTPWGDAINYDGAEQPPGARFRDRQRVLLDPRVPHRRAAPRRDRHHRRRQSHAHPGRRSRERVRASTDRKVVLIAEEAHNNVRTIRPRRRGRLWARRRLGRRLPPRAPRLPDGRARELLRELSRQHGADRDGDRRRALSSRASGRRSPANRAARASPTNRPRPSSLSIQNHDQVGNRPFGERLHHEIDPGRYAVASTLLLFAPETPLLFMGQEFAASTPFLFFTDHNPELGRLVTEGRRRRVRRLSRLRRRRPARFNPRPAGRLDVPLLEARTGTSGQRNAGVYALYRDAARAPPRRSRACPQRPRERSRRRPRSSSNRRPPLARRRSPAC